MTPCRLCGEDTAASFAGLLKCRNCGLYFKSEKHFDAPVYAPGTEADIYGTGKKRIFSAALDYMERELPARGRLLDIGCAVGELLRAAAARGWQAEGVEIDPGLAAKAAGAGFMVHIKPVEACGLDAGAYAAVSAFEVLSQMDDPASAVREMYGLLKPGGVLYVREFNASFHMPLYGLQQSGFFKPLGVRPAVAHSFNFSRRSLCIMLERAGFKDLTVRNARPTSGDPYRTGGFMGARLTGLLKFLYYMTAQALWLLSFGRVCAGSSLRVTARK